MSRWGGRALLLAVLAWAVALPARAGDPLCPDAGLLSGKLLTDVCWGCIFPIRIAGLAIGTGEVPARAAGGALCSCRDPLGVPHPGLVTSLWEPARVIELTHLPGCAPALGGLQLPLGERRLLGTIGQGEGDSSDLAFSHYHYYAFPLLALLDLFSDEGCNADGYLDFDLLYLSELDPTWSLSELAFFTREAGAGSTRSRGSSSPTARTRATLACSRRGRRPRCTGAGSPGEPWARTCSAPRPSIRSSPRASTGSRCSIRSRRRATPTSSARAPSAGASGATSLARARTTCTCSGAGKTAA